ncbi:MAG: glycosyltransferase family 39 protein [Planctomycetota bacterium]|nr:glycosyltransferase family 39 protein [Planctomycetota bacterium]
MARRRTSRTIEYPKTVLTARFRGVTPSLLAGFIAFCLVVADLDPTGAYAWLPDGPGLTVDEMFNVEQGVRLEIGSRYVALGAMSLRELFGTPDELGPNAPHGYHLPDHPPLGRYLLGVAHGLVTAVSMPSDWPSPIVTAAARFGSAVAFALTVFMVASFARRHYGITAGWTAAASLILMPRVFGHAHLASLETMIGLFFTATVLAVADRWKPGEPIATRAAILCGVLWGLALLTKVQAVLLPIPLAMWAFWHWRAAAVKSLALFGVAGAAVFFIGWPWLWSDPIGHAFEYLGRTTDRISLPVWYAGQVFADKAVPWHYPFVMFAVTVPVGLQALGLIGVIGSRVQGRELRVESRGLSVEGRVTGWRDSVVPLLLLCMTFPLIVFAVPGVAVYDGARLFLISFPLWAVLIGRGGAVALEWIASSTTRRMATVVLALLVSSQSYGVFAFRPASLSYYNLLVGGASGAARLGFEPTYWGDSVTAELLDAASNELPDGGTLAVAPVLHQFQLDDLLNQSPALRRREIRLVEYGSENAASADGLLLFNRKASLSDDLKRIVERTEPTAAVRRQDLILAAFYRTSDLVEDQSP